MSRSWDNWRHSLHVCTACEQHDAPPPQVRIFPTREFENWDAVQDKTWPVLKLFVNGAYARKLIASNIRNMMGQQGYAPNQNMYHVLKEGDDTSNADRTVTQMAATVTMGITLGNTYQAFVIPPELTAAINTIMANQQSLYNHIAPLLQQMAALSSQAQPPTQARQPVFQAPPIQHLAIPSPPAYAGYQGGYQQGYQQGRGGGCNIRRRRNGRNNNRHGHGRTPFADHMAAQGCGYGGGFGAIPPARGRTHCSFRSNLMKEHNNWNVSYSCGFDIKAVHNSITFPPHWRKYSHNVMFMRDNAQTFLSMGCDACTKGMHKALLPRNF